MFTDTPPPFELALSSNAERIVFNDNWVPHKHYQASFNAQYQVAGHLKQNQPWGLATDWRNWLVQTPEHERLCIRCMHDFHTSGMKHFAVVLDDHPVAKWQFDKAAKQNPGISFMPASDLESATNWLAAQGYDVNFEPVEFNPDWMYPSDVFNQILDKLGADKGRFVSQPA